MHHCYQHPLTALLSAHPLIWQPGNCYRFFFFPVLLSPNGCFFFFFLLIMMFSGTLEGAIVTVSKEKCKSFFLWCHLKKGGEGNKTAKKKQNCQRFPRTCLSESTWGCAQLPRGSELLPVCFDSTLSPLTQQQRVVFPTYHCPVLGAARCQWHGCRPFKRILNYFFSRRKTTNKN